jgi:hypothetical protein
MTADLASLSATAAAGDELARFELRDHLMQTMLEAAAGNPHVRRQMKRLGLRRSKASSSGPDPALYDLLACTDLGARLASEIGAIDMQPVTKVLHRIAQGVSPQEAVEQVARFTVLHIADKADSLTLVRKAIERGVRTAVREREIEEIIAVGFRNTESVDRNIRAALEHCDARSHEPDPLIGPPIGIHRLHDTVIVFTATAGTSQKGEKLDIVFRRPFIGPPDSVSRVIRSSSQPWKELTRLKRDRDEVVALAKDHVRPLAPRLRKARDTRRQIVALPVVEIRRIARELAEAVGHPIDRAMFFAGLYATLSKCGLETVARENDPSGPMARRREESPEMDIIDRIDRERTSKQRR